MLSSLKLNIFQISEKQIKPLLQAWKQRLSHWLDIVSTEYHFRFRRPTIQKQLESLKGIPRGLYIEGTNTCNAKCTFCAYPQMERPKQVMPIEDFQRFIDEYTAIEGKYVSLTPIVGDPFVDPHLFERLDYLHKNPEIQGIYFYTNAILLKPKNIEKLIAYEKKLRIYVSFGGFDRQTYKAIMGVDYFDIVTRNIEAFVDAKVKHHSSLPLTLALRCPSSNRQGEFWRKVRQWHREA